MQNYGFLKMPTQTEVGAAKQSTVGSRVMDATFFFLKKLFVVCVFVNMLDIWTKASQPENLRLTPEARFFADIYTHTPGDR